MPVAACRAHPCVGAVAGAAAPGRFVAGAQSPAFGGAAAGLLRWRLYTFRWVCLFVWLYAAEGAVRAWGDRPPGNALALVQVLLCIALFAACAAHVRLRLRAARRA